MKRVRIWWEKLNQKKAGGSKQQVYSQCKGLEVYKISKLYDPKRDSLMVAMYSNKEKS